jgi:aspartate/tyrosine/aromatic aminotransferase
MVGQDIESVIPLPLLTSQLTAEQCKLLIEKSHIYLTSNGRISMAGLNTKSVEYVAQQIDKAVRGQL